MANIHSENYGRNSHSGHDLHMSVSYDPAAR